MGLIEGSKHAETAPRLTFAIGALLARAEETRAKGLEMLRGMGRRWPEHELSARALGEAFRIEKLRVGLVAPEILGKDVDGAQLRLSSTRGMTKSNSRK